MTKNLRTRLQNGDAVIGAWLTVPSVAVAEALASCGFDWMAMDMEHGSAGVDQAYAAFGAALRHGVAPFVRLPSADPYLARRLLDQGASGLIIPDVESADAFRAFARHCYYPPRGIRGVGLSAANMWGDTFDDYTRNFEPILVPQIETKTGIEQASNIAALSEVSALFIGPYDLSADLGELGNFTSEEFLACLESFKQSCTHTKKCAGIHQVTPDLAELDERIGEGYRFIAFGTDMIAMRHAFSGLRDRPSAGKVGSK